MHHRTNLEHAIQHGQEFRAGVTGRLLMPLAQQDQLKEKTR
jgi:hypothetical protein